MCFYFYFMFYIHKYFFFFFSSRRRHTRFKCDWSSDVCSSDLVDRRVKNKVAARGELRRQVRQGMIRQDHHGIRGCTHVEFVSKQLLKRKSSRFRSERCTIGEFRALSHAELPPLCLHIVLPGNRERWLCCTVIVQAYEAIEDKGGQLLCRDGLDRIRRPLARIKGYDTSTLLNTQDSAIRRPRGGRCRQDNCSRSKQNENRNQPKQPSSRRKGYTLHSCLSSDSERWLWTPPNRHGGPRRAPENPIYY